MENIKRIIKKDQYESYADCILSEQVSAPEIVELFEDKKFYKWYKRKYMPLSIDPDNHEYE